MMETLTMRRRYVAGVLVTLLLGAIVGLLTIGATPAHALFVTEVHEQTYHSVKPFPVELTVEASAAEVREKAIGKDRFSVDVTYSDGSVRQAAAEDYEIAPAEIPAGFKGDFEGELTYREGGHEVSAGFSFAVNGAYGAQYGHTLVFGRGIPADVYGSETLTNTTWGIEEASCSPRWDKSQLTSVTEIDTVAPRTMANWFTSAASLRKVSLTRIDTSQVVSMAGLFYDCTALSTIEGVGSWNTASVVNLESAFRNTFGLTAIDVSRWNVGRCSNFASMFCMYPEGASNLTSVGDLSGWNMSSATTLSCMFQRCNKLKSVGDIGRWNISRVTSLADLFQSNAALTYVGDLSKWDVSHVTNMRETFQGCSALASVGDIKAWNTANVTTMYQMFQWCSSLSANCRYWDVSKVTSYDNFNGNGASGVIAPNW